MKTNKLAAGLLTLTLGLFVVSASHATSFTGSFATTVPEADATGISSTISVADTAVISSLSITVNIDHPWIGDLAMYLTAPDGTLLTLLDRPGLRPGSGLGSCCGSGADLESITFDDAAILAAEDIVSSFDLNPVASPTDPLSVLMGSLVAGNWTLTIADFAQGQLNTTPPSWALNINESVAPVPVPAALWLLLGGLSLLRLGGRRASRAEHTIR